MATLAFDVGGTRLKAAVVSDGRSRSVTARATAALDGDGVVALLRAVGAELAAEHDVDAIGIAVPGIVDGGRVVALPGKFDGLVGRDLGGELAAVLRAPATVVNDAIAAGVGEATAGAGAGHSRVVTMTIGTGVGTAVVEDGVPLGSGPWGGGLMGGQIPISDDEDGLPDTNGRRGTIEACCAAARLLDAARAAGCEAADVADLLARWRAGDAAACAGVASYRHALERALVALAQAHAPTVIVVGGGPVSTDPGWLLDGMTDAVRARLWPGQQVDVVPAALGDAAALVGVAALAVG
jgi:glucokinase